MTRDFLQRATIGTSFDVRWSLVAQAIPENELFLSKNVNLPESLLRVSDYSIWVQYPAGAFCWVPFSLSKANITLAMRKLPTCFAIISTAILTSDKPSLIPIPHPLIRRNTWRRAWAGHETNASHG